MPKAPRVMTAFGAVMQDFRLRYGFSHQDLVRRGWLSRSQIEQLSRMATKSQAVQQMTQERRAQIIFDLATATARWIQDRNEGDLPDFANFVELVRVRLHEAAQEDSADALREPLAISIAMRLQVLTGRPLLQMAMDLEDPAATLETLWAKWSPESRCQ